MVVSGGGIKAVAAAIATMEQLEKKGETVEAVVGSSGGAYFGAFFGRFGETKTIIQSIHKLVAAHTPGDILNVQNLEDIIETGGLSDLTSFLRIMAEESGLGDQDSFSSEKSFLVTAADVDNNRLEIYYCSNGLCSNLACQSNETLTVMEAVHRSMLVFGDMPSRKKGSSVFLDGAVFSFLPTEAAVALRENDSPVNIIAVRVTSSEKKRDDVFGLVGDLVDNQINNQEDWK